MTRQESAIRQAFEQAFGGIVVMPKALARIAVDVVRRAVHDEADLSEIGLERTTFHLYGDVLVEGYRVIPRPTLAERPALGAQRQGDQA